ncbi:sigma-54-dependent transcriptional regulator [Novosphingobium aerophilum]|uniref:Sigma-54-dependent Fis family transcriptional regulator n=1 Tax=Novosphingobium aerophilum TaxID=2839843 RepID=A0A7X1F4C2_9SPHN|nr:sigma-54 dependent transcriptional regulator [Novosphingobium aerophilum]MBC2650155.1 sigma-54-dependent Fis family transcriptional regulator [Novosphingobium aerophilum]
MTAEPNTTRIALVEDDHDLLHAVTQYLTLAGHEVVPFAHAPDALAALDAEWDGVVVSDVRMPGITGIELFRRLREKDAELPVILMTGHGDIAMAVDLLKSGAWDFLTKPFAPEALLAAVERAARARSLVLDNRRLKAQATADQASALIGESAAITRLRAMLPALADSDLDVLIEGESGTGKELFARLLHRAGKRRRHRCLSISCAGLPDALEDELFAAGGQASMLSAHRGTLILDDLDLASPRLQARLVHTAEERALRPAGSKEPIPLDLRIVALAGTNARRAEESIVPALFYRIAAVRLTMPALRDRREDIPALFAHHVGLVTTRLRQPIPPMTPAVRDVLRFHDWPGNVRELAHFAERFVLGLLDLDSAAPGLAAQPGLTERVEAFEREAIIDAVIAAKGEIGKAIAALGIPRKTFYNRVHKLGIDLPGLRRNSELWARI